MALAAWPELTRFAERAADDPKAAEFSKAFFPAMHVALAREESLLRRNGDKQGLVVCIKDAMHAASQVLTSICPNIRPCSYRIQVPGLSRGKWPDYAFTNGLRYYIIEQKSVLRFNEFAQVLVEGLLIKSKDPTNARFAGLFNYLHQNRAAFDQLACFEGRCIVDRICVLIPERAYTGYAVEEVDALFEDMRAWLA